MISALLVGLVVGLALSLPPGPIAVAVIRQALEGKYREGYQMAMSASSMDVLYATIAAFASTAIVSTLIDAIQSRPWVMLAFQIASIITLVFLGIAYFRATRREVASTTRKEQAQEARARRLGFRSPAAVGVMIAITNLASPTFLPSLVVIIGYLHANGWVEPRPLPNLAYAVGFGGGAFAWFLILLRLLHRLRHRIPANFIAMIYRFAGGTFLLFAGILLYHVLMETDWSTLAPR
jgi:threonine/homoserine/homoserine lactone efflux protein